MTEAENQIHGAHEALLTRLSQTRKTIGAMREQERQILRQIGDCEAAGRVFGVTLRAPDIIPAAAKEADPFKLKDFVLSALAKSPDGIKAAPLQRAYKEFSGREIHQKSVGVALYRLKRAGLADITGHLWYPINPTDTRSVT